ncbi:MAG: hypothetical protein KY475_08475 [Planctomycetes bacterium]|nr:hypothetical protein [Planctomycetota bacterium]
MSRRRSPVRSSDAQENYAHDRRQEDDLALLVRRFINTHDCSNYRAVRGPILLFCMVEAIEPAVFAGLADDQTRHLWSHGGWQDLIAEDGPSATSTPPTTPFGVEASQPMSNRAG